MTREEYKKKWTKNWECVIYFIDCEIIGNIWQDGERLLCTKEKE